MIDLHLHIDGSFRPQTIYELAKEMNIPLPADSVEGLLPYIQVPEDCRSLEEYLERFTLPLQVIQTPHAIERVTYELIVDLAAQGLDQAELRFAPKSCANNASQKEIVEAAIKGLDRGIHETGMKAGLILCAMRGNSFEDNMETLMLVKEYLGKGVIAFDIAGAEIVFKTHLYADLFAKAKELDVPYTIHAGEGDGPESIRAALDFGAKRLGHGIRVYEDPELMKRVRDEKIVLEVCPISNLHTKVVDDMKDYPLRKLFDYGILVTINTDNMTMSNTTLQKEYDFIKKHYHFTDDEIKQMNENAYQASFIK